MARFDDALQELYQVPVAQFVTERKRLAGELKSDGDASGAKELLARKRPTISAWVVNQLYWHARDAFDDLMATAEKLRNGDLKASAAHRDAIAKLRKRASTLLEEAGHAPTESTLRRVTTTLSALAATGGFDPDPPGTLAEDRDPPGFEAVGIPSGPIERDDEPAPKKHEAKKHDKHDGHGKPDKHDKHDGKDDLAKARAKAQKEREKAEAEEAERRAAEMAEKKRAEEHEKRVAQERHRLEAALRNAKAEVHDKERDLVALEKQVAAAQKAIEKAQEIADDLEAKLAELDEGN